MANEVAWPHLGRPKGQVTEELRLTPVAKRLQELLGQEVKKADEAYGDNVKKQISDLKEGDVLVLSKRGETGILWQHRHDIAGVNGSLLALYQWSAYLKLSRHRLKESLVHHDFFSMEGNEGGVDEKPLFDGLSTVALLRDDNSEPH